MKEIFPRTRKVSLKSPKNKKEKREKRGRMELISYNRYSVSAEIGKKKKRMKKTRMKKIRRKMLI